MEVTSLFSTPSEEQRLLKEKGLQFACSDVGNADRFVAMHGHELRYLKEDRRWIAWDGVRWNASQANVLQRATQTVRSIFDEAKNCTNNQGSRELALLAARSQNKQRIEAMLPMAAERLSVSAENFDTDHMKINCLNGIVDLESGERITRTPEHHVTKCAAANYLPSEKCPQWIAFLKQVFLDDAEVIEFVQRALGYSMTGLTREQHLFIAYGLGANGKTTLFETVLEIIGDYGRTVEFSTFLNTDKTDARSREAVVALKGMRFAVASETDNTKKWNESLVKKLTGSDTLTGAKLYGNSFDFKPTHKLWFQANHLPGVKDASHGFWRRPIVIPFKAKFEGSARDTGLRERLLSERDAIFGWLVAGARKYLEKGLGDVPRACQEATEQYRQDNDVMGRFINDRLERAKGSTVGVASVYTEYEDWCRFENEQPTSMKFFANALEERGLHKKRVSQGVVLLGYKIKSPYPANDNKMMTVPTPVGELFGSGADSYEEWTKKPESETDRIMEMLRRSG